MNSSDKSVQVTNTGSAESLNGLDTTVKTKKNLHKQLDKFSLLIGLPAVRQSHR
jgi:hypothetical protein